MSYTKTNWQTGDVIDAEKLNKMEQGIEDANGILNGDTVTSATDTDTVFINQSNLLKKITLSNLVTYIKNKIGSLKNPNALTFTGAVTETYDGSAAKTINIPSGSNTTVIDNTIPRVEKTSTDTEASIEANTLYVWPEMTSLSITLTAPEDTSIVNEYHFIFTSGATATTLSLPDTLKVDAYTIDANKVYEVSILENICYVRGVSNA